MENIADNIEEIDEEFLVYRDLCLHPNIPSFYGLYFNPGKKREEDQLWFVMEVVHHYDCECLSTKVFVYQLCTGGSVTDLVQALKKGKTCLPEAIIAFILKETMDVSV